MAQKECRKCRVVKAADLFSNSAKRPDGKQDVCKECVSAYMNARHAARSDELNAKNAARRANRTDEEREAWKQYMRDYYRAHPEKFVVTDPAKINTRRTNEWLRRQNPDARDAKRQRDRAAYEANPAPYKESAARRRDRLAAARVGEVTARDWKRIIARQDGCCFYCGDRSELTVDHLIPLIRGGLHSVGNIVAACSTCNARKGRKTRAEYVVWLKRMAEATA